MCVMCNCCEFVKSGILLTALGKCSGGGAGEVQERAKVSLIFRPFWSEARQFSASHYRTGGLHHGPRYCGLGPSSGLKSHLQPSSAQSTRVLTAWATYRTICTSEPSCTHCNRGRQKLWATIMTCWPSNMVNRQTWSVSKKFSLWVIPQIVMGYNFMPLFSCWSPFPRKRKCTPRLLKGRTELFQQGHK